MEQYMERHIVVLNMVTSASRGLCSSLKWYETLNPGLNETPATLYVKQLLTDTWAH